MQPSTAVGLRNPARGEGGGETQGEEEAGVVIRGQRGQKRARRSPYVWGNLADKK